MQRHSSNLQRLLWLNCSNIIRSSAAPGISTFFSITGSSDLLENLELISLASWKTTSPHLLILSLEVAYEVPRVLSRDRSHPIDFRFDIYPLHTFTHKSESHQWETQIYLEPKISSLGALILHQHA
jgi:hypothetical protein